MLAPCLRQELNLNENVVTSTPDSDCYPCFLHEFQVASFGYFHGSVDLLI